MQELENFLTCAKEEGISEDIQRHKEVRQEEEEGVVVVLRKRARIVCVCMCVCVHACVCVWCASIVLVKVVLRPFCILVLTLFSYLSNVIIYL